MTLNYQEEDRNLSLVDTADQVIQHRCTSFGGHADDKPAFDVVGMVALLVLEAAVANLETVLWGVLKGVNKCDEISKSALHVFNCIH